MNDKVTTRLRSRITTDGIDRAPHRVCMRGMGLDDEAMARPFIGVVIGEEFHGRKHLAVFGVRQHVTIIVVEQRKPFRDGFDRVDKLLFGAFVVGDVLRRSK